MYRLDDSGAIQAFDILSGLAQPVYQVQPPVVSRAYPLSDAFAALMSHSEQALGAEVTAPEPRHLHAKKEAISGHLPFSSSLPIFLKVKALQDGTCGVAWSEEELIVRSDGVFIYLADHVAGVRFDRRQYPPQGRDSPVESPPERKLVRSRLLTTCVSCTAVQYLQFT